MMDHKKRSWKKLDRIDRIDRNILNELQKMTVSQTLNWRNVSACHLHPV